ncbi:hypothetical protein VNO78_28973 [Psophocarpus tetragonolobus]|uniref:Uncharacterized protein n=1 Tax=Psophocarpus tetragonolobus TaxID=3891 RepID=A0AAN9RU39_PSOTE
MEIEGVDQSQVESSSLNYKDSLLKMVGDHHANIPLENINDILLSKEKVYEENGFSDTDFDLCHNIPISQTEYKEWCKPWRSSLIMNLLGKTISLRFLENSLQQLWVKNESNNLGTMLKVDKLTSIHSRGCFARICVKVNLEKKLVPRIQVLGKSLPVEY